jgi:hypothetical protein
MKTIKTIGLFILTMVLFSGMVMAQDLKISPESISINAYPGETVSFQVNVTTSGNYAVYLNYYLTGNSTPINLSISPTFPIIVEGKETVDVAFTIPTYIEPQTFKIWLNASVYTVEKIVTVPGGSSGGSGSTTIYEDRIVEVNNKTLIDEYESSLNELRNQIDSINSESNNYGESIDEEKKSKWLDSKTSVFVGGFIAGFIIIYLLTYMFNRPEIPEVKEDTNDTNKDNQEN